jgi:hypothetical protein
MEKEMICLIELKGQMTIKECDRLLEKLDLKRRELELKLQQKQFYYDTQLSY